MFRKPDFQLSHFLAKLILSCPPFGQECEFSVVWIEMGNKLIVSCKDRNEPLSVEKMAFWDKIYILKGNLWLWQGRRHMLMIS